MPTHYRDALDAILSGRYAVSPRGVVYDFTAPDGTPIRLPVKTGKEDGPLVAIPLPRKAPYRTMVPVCFLIAAQYLRRPRPGEVLRHLDDRKPNATLRNLAWGTQSDNLRDQYRNGRRRRDRAHLARWTV